MVAFPASMDHGETDRARGPTGDTTRSTQHTGQEDSEQEASDQSYSDQEASDRYPTQEASDQSASGQKYPEGASSDQEGTLRLERNVDAFVEAPLGRYVMGPGWLHFCATPRLWGATLWGRAEQQNLTSLFALVERTIERAGEHVSLLDIRGLEHVDLASFGLIGRYMSRHRSTLARRVLRHAVIRAEGVLGAVVSGSYEIFAAPYPVSLFTNLGEALDWLDPPLERSIKESVALLCENAAGVPSLLTQLHTVLGTDLDHADLARAAERMGITARTLQRRLQALGTSFRAELDITRIREAQRRMLHSDCALTEVAVDLGFSSLQNFSRQFRRVVGEAPSAWRQRVRTRN